MNPDKSSNIVIGNTASAAGDTHIAIGDSALIDGKTAITIGRSSGGGGNFSVYIGDQAGLSSNGHNTVSIGRNSGASSFATYNEGVHVGRNSGIAVLGKQCICVGCFAGGLGPGLGSLSLGYRAGYETAGSYSIAIGWKAGEINQASNSVVISSLGNVASTSSSRFYAEPIRNTSSSALGNTLTYNTTTKEIGYMTGDPLRLTGGIMTGTLNGSDIIPVTHNTYDLGSDSVRWRDIYLVNTPTVTSDFNLKKNIIPLKKGMCFIESLKPVSYNLKDSKNKTLHYGLIAQDVEKIISTNEFAGICKGDSGYSLRYSEFIAPLIKSVQELNSRIKELEKNIQ